MSQPTHISTLFAVLINNKYDPQLMQFASWQEVLCFVNSERQELGNPELKIEEIKGLNFIEINEDVPQVSLYIESFKISLST